MGTHAHSALALAPNVTLIIALPSSCQINNLFLCSGADCHDVADQHWINGYPTPIANPMSSYPRYQPFRKSWGINAMGSVVVEAEAEDGTCGVGEEEWESWPGGGGGGGGG